MRKEIPPKRRYFFWAWSWAILLTIHFISFRIIFTDKYFILLILFAWNKKRTVLIFFNIFLNHFHKFPLLSKVIAQLHNSSRELQLKNLHFQSVYSLSFFSFCNVIIYLNLLSEILSHYSNNYNRNERNERH